MSNAKLVTKDDLKEMYQRILPYLGGSADAGFTPIGTIIAVMGNSAPANYLPCDGSTYNISDYPELANYFEEQFGSSNYFGGDGTTTFGIVDLSGEFLRGTGTNSHTNQGSGSAVGTHQNATELPLFTTVNAESSLLFPVHATGSQETKPKIINADTVTSTGDTFGTLDFKGRPSGVNPVRATSRPTNTSVLFCIATKNIYLNPSLDYSTDEKVVGTWIDGKPLYQKTLTKQVTYTTVSTIQHEELTDASLGSISQVIGFSGVARKGDFVAPIMGCYNQSKQDNIQQFCSCRFNMATNTFMLDLFYPISNVTITTYITIQYTKTSD